MTADLHDGSVPWKDRPAAWRRRAKRGLLALLAIGGGHAAEPPPVGEPTPYPAADRSVVLVDRSRLVLDDDRRRAAARALTLLARNHADHPSVTPLVRARALAVARALEPRDRDAVVADGQWRLGVRPRPLPEESTLLRIASVLVDTARILLATDREGGNPAENAHLANLLLSVGSAIDPALGDAMPAPADWRGAFPGPKPAPGDGPSRQPRSPAGPALAVERSSLQVILPDAQGTGARAGATEAGWRLAVVTSRVRAAEDQPGSASALRSPAIRFEPEAPAALLPVPGLVELPAVPGTAPFECVIALPADAVAAGGAATRLLSLPVALVADAPMSGTHLDPRMVVAGELRPDGMLAWPGGPTVPVLEAAAVAGCRAVIVPEGCREALRDLVILGRIDLFRRVQILTASTFEEARALAAEAGGVRESLDEFRILQIRAAQGRLTKGESIEGLRRIVGRTPHHASAFFLLASTQHGPQGELSRPASRRLILEAAKPLVDAARGADEWVRPTVLTADQLGDLRSTLIRLRPRLAVEARSCADAAVDLARSLERFRLQPPRSSDGQSKMVAALKRATARLRRELSELDRLAS